MMKSTDYVRYAALAAALILLVGALVAPSQPKPVAPAQSAGQTVTAVPPPGAPATSIAPTPLQATPQQATPIPATPSTEPEAVAHMRIVLQRWFGDAGSTARLTDIRQTEWPDACFGAGYAYESCAKGIVPGWVMTFAVNGAAYTFRTDPQAYRFRLTAAPTPEFGTTIISWTGNNGVEMDNCSTAEIGSRAVAFGDCGGLMVAGHFVNAANWQLLSRHVERFASFRARTSAGAIYFTGQGSEAATPADQRAIAELAQLMYMEARGGQAATGMNALALTRDVAPDRAPVCLTVDVTGKVVVTDCKPGAAPQQLRMNSGGLEKMYRWMDQLQPFDLKLTEKEVMTKISFAGRGEKMASDADKQSIRTFADGLIAEAREQGTLQPNPAMVRYALPLILPEGMDWKPDQSAANDRRFYARAEDPANPDWRWVQLRGSLEEPARPSDKHVLVQLRGSEGIAYNFGEGHTIIWKEDNTHFTVSTSFGLSQTLEIAGSLHPLQLEEFEQVMRERAQLLVQPLAPAK